MTEGERTGLAYPGDQHLSIDDDGDEPLEDNPGNDGAPDDDEFGGPHFDDPVW